MNMSNKDMSCWVGLFFEGLVLRSYMLGNLTNDQAWILGGMGWGLLIIFTIYFFLDNKNEK